MDERAVDERHVLAARLAAHRLRSPDLPDVPTAVGHLLAVQGQEFHPSLWGLTRRLRPEARPGAAGAVAACDRGEMVRTHVLRPTWHLVRSDDVRWLLELSAPRVHRANGTMYRQVGTDGHAAEVDLVVASVAERPRTRRELAGLLAAQGRPLDGMALGYVLMQAELDRLLVSGPLDGKQQTYAAFDDRVPAGYGPLGERFDRDAALVELLRRYLAGRAYATVKDVAQWSGFTLTDVRHALDLLGEDVVAVPGAGTLEGATLWRLADADARVVDPGPFVGALAPDGDPGRPVVDLLQSYDELFMSYGETRALVVAEGVDLGDRLGSFIHGLAVDGVVVGRWRWVVGTRDVVVEPQWRRAPTPAETAAFDEQVAAVSAHWGRTRTT
ncbi:DNA glycosylase AlkZ-like family protein [Cellulosimicrobium protaetiae]|uniref:Winged helix DNA-binding domain-containing protein n=1 Tax=Cellulosimicrobium protaetiae TaxID=2587808 RepID=A0A6M5UA58_9MICO|nr:crosslink repair DNA glycosylase YcaQ family protein [Cellulosimicrobium protaetiae]QJW35397.1 winged helix DNA-binding domain-containing protein [Cellulosimicrobium protaetiae]